MGDIRVVIVDDDKLVRRALAVFLGATDDIVIVGNAVDGAAGIALVEETQPDVVLLDIQMPRMGGVETATEIAARCPSTRVLAITTFGTIEMILPMLRAGASGYLLKDAEPEVIVEAVRLVHMGAAALSPAIAAQLLETTSAGQLASNDVHPPSHHLSGREQDILEQLASGRSNAEIARATHLSESTVKTHLSSIMAKWDVRDRVQIVIRAARIGLIRFD